MVTPREGRIKLSLNVIHPTQDLSGLCNKIGMVPKILWKKGEEKRSPKGKKLQGVRDNSRFLVEFGAASTLPLAEQIEVALATLQMHRLPLRRLVSSGGKLHLFAGYFCAENTIETLDFELLKALADLRINLVLDVYPPDDAAQIVLPDSARTEMP